MNIPVVETFCSIQGEGRRTGIPSIFLRTIGCNLRCSWKGKNGPSICDSAFTSHCCEKPSMTTTEEVIEHLKSYDPWYELVVTGGEPMLHQDSLIELFKNTDRIITIETNGTQPLKSEIVPYVTLFSISPKLPSSACFEGTTVPVTLQEKHKHDIANHHVLDYIMTGMACQLKFVYAGPDSEDEVIEFLKDLETKAKQTLTTHQYIYYKECMNNTPILLMPEGATTEDINRNAEQAIETCMRQGWRYCDRTHIRIWGNQRSK